MPGFSPLPERPVHGAASDLAQRKPTVALNREGSWVAWDVTRNLSAAVSRNEPAGVKRETLFASVLVHSLTFPDMS